jgi:hypothetical protein
MVPTSNYGPDFSHPWCADMFLPMCHILLCIELLSVDCQMCNQCTHIWAVSSNWFGVLHTLFTIRERPWPPVSLVSVWYTNPNLYIVIKATGYRLDHRMIGVRSSVGAGNFSLRHSIQAGSGAHPASYPMRTTGSFPGRKAAGAWSWPLTSILYRGQGMRGAIPPLPQYVFMEWCLVKQRANFIFTF